MSRKILTVSLSTLVAFLVQFSTQIAFDYFGFCVIKTSNILSNQTEANTKPHLSIQSHVPFNFNIYIK
ncbi:hypothetical protein GLYMA_08G251950v4 [Glycine max]|nr:hypothetical protein GLYMA_08G251950v4 [Glycine max]KAH1053012.1 hypothetical protein GYH30_022348 [Glycine max]